jgi:hypothetical protein
MGKRFIVRRRGKVITNAVTVDFDNINRRDLSKTTEEKAEILQEIFVKEATDEYKIAKKFY